MVELRLRLKLLNFSCYCLGYWYLVKVQMMVAHFAALPASFQVDQFSWLVPYSAFSIIAYLPWFGSKVERNFAVSP